MAAEPIPTTTGPVPHAGHPGLRSIRRETLFIAGAIVIVLVLGGLSLYFGPSHPTSLRGTMFDPNTPRDQVQAQAQAQAQAKPAP